MIKSEWIVATMAARNALEVASADVYQGAECMVLSTGSVFRAVRAGTGATMWAGVCTASGTWTPVFSGEAQIKTSDPAMSAYAATYSRIGDLVMADATFEGELSSATVAREFKMSVPVDPGDVFGGAGGAVSGSVAMFDVLAIAAAGTDFFPPAIYATEDAKTVTIFFNSNEAADSYFGGNVRFSYMVREA
jgi:hypothetical protein